jgi:anti-sigma factor RsiW
MAECEFRARLMRYHDGELAPSERREMDEHLARCPDCAQELARLQALTRLVTGLPAPDVSGVALAKLHESVGHVRERVITRICRPVALAAAMVLAVCAFWLHYAQPSGAVEAGPPAEWEAAAVTFDAEAARADAGNSFALWMVEGLSGENRP